MNLLSFYQTGISESGTADYLAGHNLLLAHAKAYRLYDRKYRQIQKGSG